MVGWTETASQTPAEESATARLEFQSDREPNLNLIASGKSPGEKDELEQGSTFANRARITKRRKM